MNLGVETETKKILNGKRKRNKWTNTKKKCEQIKKTIHRLIVWTFKWKSKDSWKKSCRYKTEKVAFPPFLYYCEKFSNQMTFCAYLDYNTVCFDVKLIGLFLTLQVKFSIRILHQQNKKSYAQVMSCLICCFHEENKLL